MVASIVLKVEMREQSPAAGLEVMVSEQSPVAVVEVKWMQCRVVGRR